MSGKTIGNLKVGDSAEFTKTVSETDIYLYAGVSGDFNPAHINEEYAKETFFRTRIAHGMLPAGFISTVIGTKLPGPGTIYLDQSLKFLAPVRIGDTITARVEVKEIMAERNKVRLKTACINQDGITVLEGEGVVSPPKPK
ncbi:MAG: MaoC family dehydratase [Deltaproteobacteria bacterium]|nr:MaoC family dehydratase [Deltaproteobacteria bacterium]